MCHHFSHFNGIKRHNCRQASHIASTMEAVWHLLFRTRTKRKRCIVFTFLLKCSGTDAIQLYAPYSIICSTIRIVQIVRSGIFRANAFRVRVKVIPQINPAKIHKRNAAHCFRGKCCAICDTVRVYLFVTLHLFPANDITKTRTEESDNSNSRRSNIYSCILLQSEGGVALRKWLN